MSVRVPMTNDSHMLKGLNIARVSTVAFFVDTQLHSQISDIVKAGAQVTVVASESKLQRDIQGSRYISIEIPRKIQLVSDFLALIRLWVFFRRSNFDIVHSTTPKAGLLCCLAAKFAGVPVRLHTFTGQPWVGLSGVKRFLSVTSDKLISRLNTRCYADSHSQKDFIVQNGIAQREQISVLGSGSLAGIDLQRFDPSNFSQEEKCLFKSGLGIPSSSAVLLFVGRLSRDKGLVELIAAYQQVIADDSDVYLILLGPCETDLDALFDDLPASIKGKIVMPGFSEEPERYMAIADVLVLPSYREGFGTVVIEAAAMGVPAIGSNIYGLSDAIVDEQTGLLVPVKSSDALAVAIKRLLSDPVTRKNLGHRARERVNKEFSSRHVSDLVVNEYVKLFNVHKGLG